MGKNVRVRWVTNKERAELVNDPARFMVRGSGFVFLFGVFIPWPVNVVLSLLSGHMPNILRFVLAMAVPDALILIVCAAFIMGYSQSSACGIKAPGWIPMCLAPFLQFAAYPFLLFVASFFSFLAPNNTLSMDNTESFLLQLGPVWGYLLLCVFPALAEELLCRGIIYGMLRRRSAFAAFLMSTLCFSLMHGNFDQIAYSALLGLLLCAVREFTGSVFPCMLMHFLLNSISVTMIYFGDDIFGPTLDVVQDTPRMSFWDENSGLFAIGVIGIVIVIGLLLVLRHFSRYEHDDVVNKAVPFFALPYLIGLVTRVVFIFI